MERDEVYVPRTRSDLGIPKEQGSHKIDYDEYFGDTPIYTLYMLVRQQLLAFPAYLCKQYRPLLRTPQFNAHGGSQCTTYRARNTIQSGRTTSIVSDARAHSARDVGTSRR